MNPMILCPVSGVLILEKAFGIHDTFIYTADKYNPYVQLLVDYEIDPLWRTITHKNTWKPVWNEEFEL